MNLPLDVYIAFATLTFLFLLSLDVMSYVRKTNEPDPESGFEPKALVIIPCRGRDLTLRKTFVIDRDGKIVKIYPKVQPQDHEKEIIEFLRGLDPVLD